MFSPAEVMKLSCVLFLAVVAIVTAESYEYLQNSHSQEDPQSNYYSSRRGRPSRGGFVGLVWRKFGVHIIASKKCVIFSILVGKDEALAFECIVFF